MVGLSCRLAQPWNAAEARVSSRWQNPGSSLQFDISSCVWNTRGVKRLRSGTLQLCPATHHCLARFTAQLSRLKIQDWLGIKTHAHVPLHKRREKSQVPPFSSGQQGVPLPTAKCPSAPQFSERNAFALPPVMKVT